MLTRRLASVALVAVFAPFALAACGSPDRIEPSDVATPRLAAKATPTVFPAPSASETAQPPASAAPSPSATGGDGGDGGNGGTDGGDVVQATGDNKFVPESLTVKAGTTVTWKAVGFHTVTGGKDGQPDPSSPMKSPMGFQTYSVTFDEPGTYPYFCQPHVSVGMVGEIVVT